MKLEKGNSISSIQGFVHAVNKKSCLFQEIVGFGIISNVLTVVQFQEREH